MPIAIGPTRSRARQAWCERATALAQLGSLALPIGPNRCITWRRILAGLSLICHLSLSVRLSGHLSEHALLCCKVAVINGCVPRGANRLSRTHLATLSLSLSLGRTLVAIRTGRICLIHKLVATSSNRPARAMRAGREWRCRSQRTDVRGPTCAGPACACCASLSHRHSPLHWINYSPFALLPYICMHIQTTAIQIMQE